MVSSSTICPGWPASTPEEERTLLFGPEDRLVVNHDHELVTSLEPLVEQLMARMKDTQVQH